MGIKCLSIGLSLLMYLSTCGITVHEHFCKNELKSIAFWTKAKACHAAQKVCPHHPPGPDDKNCCDNETSYHQAEWTGPTADVTPLIPILFHKIEWYIRNDSWPFVNKIFPHQLERPPPEKRSKHLLFQSFLC